MKFDVNIYKAVSILKKGGIIAYPTEAVYGLGCDPFNKDAVCRLLKLKNRSQDKGLILIISSWGQIENLIKPVDNGSLDEVKKTWPGHITWIFPSKNTPKWITGRYGSVALRMVNFSLAKDLCNCYGSPIVSTSANLEAFPPARDEKELNKYFQTGIDFIVEGKTGGFEKASQIRDVLTGKIIRD